MPTPAEVLRDPEFFQLPLEERMKVLGKLDPEFTGLAKSEQIKVVSQQKLKGGADALKQSPLGTGGGAGGADEGAMPSPEETPAPSSFLGDVGRAGLGFAKGAVGSVGETIGSLYQMARHPIDTAAAAATAKEPVTGINMNALTAVSPLLAAGSQLAQTFAPKIGNVAKAFEEGSPEATGEAVGSLVGTGAQLAAPLKVPKLTQAIETLIPGVSRAGRAAKYGAAARKTMTEAIAVPKRLEKLKQRVMPKLLEKGITGDIESMAGQVASHLDDASTELNKAFSQIPKGQRTNIKEAMNALKAHQKKLVVNGEVIPGAETSFNSADKLIASLHRLRRASGRGKGLYEVPYDDILKIKRTLDEQVYGRKGSLPTVTEGSQMEIQKMAADSLRRSLSKATPNVGELNGKVAMWLDAQKVLEAAKAPPVSGALGKLAKTGATALGAKAGGISGAYIGHQGGTFLQKALSSPGWRTRKAGIQQGLANRLARGDTLGFYKMLGSITNISPKAAIAELSTQAADLGSEEEEE